MNQPLTASSCPQTPPEVAKTAQPLNSYALLGNSKEVAISHNGALYRLSTTKLGKLILTK